jgi:hypothetical protein
MPTISNLQGNLRLNSGVFEIFQGTGIVPNLYTSSIVSPSSVITGSYANMYVVPEGAGGRLVFGTGLNVGLAFNDSKDVKYHYQNQYWLLMTGATQNGSFSRYTGSQGLQVNSTGVSLNRADFPSTCFFKAQILPLDLNSKIDKLYNSGTFAVGEPDYINFGKMDQGVLPEKVNISGNLLFRSPRSESYITMENSTNINAQIQIRSSSPTGAIANDTFIGPNVTIGKNNYVDTFSTGLNGTYQQNNYILGTNNWLFNDKNSNTSSTYSMVNGNSNTVRSSDKLIVLGNSSAISSGSDILLVGSNALIRLSTGNLVIGNSTTLHNSNSSIYLGTNNIVSTGVRSMDSSMMLGRDNSINRSTSGRLITNSTGSNVNLVGQGNAIFASDFNNINIAGNTNSLIDTRNTISYINSFGANNYFSSGIQSINNLGQANQIGGASNVNSFGNDITNQFVTGLSTIGNNNLNKTLNTSISLGNSNKLFNTNNSILVGNSNTLGNGYFTLNGTNISPVSNTILQQNILVGNNSLNYINRSVLIGNNSRSLTAKNTTGANSILIGDTNFSSGSNNLVLGNATSIYGTGNNISNISIGNNNNLFNTNSSVIVGNDNTSTGISSNNNSALGLSNTFKNSSNNIALGNGNIFNNESDSLKVNLGPNNLIFNSSGLNIGPRSLRAGNVYLSGASGLSLSQSLDEINNQKALNYITNQSWHFSTTSFERTGSNGELIYSLDREVQSTNGQDYGQLYTPIKIPSTIQVPNTIGRGDYARTLVTGTYDLYVGILRNGGLEYGFQNAKTRLANSLPQPTYGYGSSGEAEYFRAAEIANTNPPPYYYFYARYQGTNFSVISYNAVKNTNDSRGIWTLYTGSLGQNPSQYKILLLNNYESGQTIAPDTIPLSNWYSLGSWANDTSSSLYVSLQSINSLPQATITNIPNLEPVVSSRRMRYINVDTPVDGYNWTPGAFLPVYY